MFSYMVRGSYRRHEFVIRCPGCPDLFTLNETRNLRFWPVVNQILVSLTMPGDMLADRT